MLAAQVNARKHENLRIILGFEWSGGLCLCEALLWWVVIAVAAAGRGFGLIWVDYPPPCLRAGRSCGSPLHCVRIAGRMDARCVAIVFSAYVGRLCMMRGSIVAAFVM